MKPVFFGKALEAAVRIVSECPVPAGPDVLVVRDLQGRLSIAVNRPRGSAADLAEYFEKRIPELGPFQGSPAVLCQDDFFEPDRVFRDPAIVEYAGEAGSVRLLDRRITGHAWASAGTVREGSIPRLAFYGLKGGVGRSTALTITAYSLAKTGKRVLVADLDLESPGLSAMLLPREKQPDYGVVDWLVENPLQQGKAVLGAMTASSPLSDSLNAEIRVAPAMGRDDPYYLDKLNRVYGGRADEFARGIESLIDSLERREKPDVVLIDSRAGMHDLAAISIVRLADESFLFATDTEACWLGYQALFEHWRQRPRIASAVRDRLTMVSAQFPESDQLNRAKRFLDRSYSLWSSTLYDTADPSDGSAVFNYGEEAEDAPHFPRRIRWNARFQEFDPLAISAGLFTDDEIRAAFGDFLDGVLSLTGFEA